ncbi:hypothetical protein DFH09DRAFT_1310926 [Mycena vulgaris]|nr:hypothetical protein DFH09DRAFT_1310926 [Mycena vulgaris]
MDDGPPVEAKFHSESSLDEDGPRNDQYTGAFFPKAHHLVVAGGKFKSITNITQAAPTVPSDFRTIPMGDLDLRHEIRLNSGVVNRWDRTAPVRRVYSARIHGSKSKMTVAVYQGENAEKEWRKDISRYSWLLHPNVVQLYATASRSGVHAAVFHDELIPATQILEKHHDSHFSTVYLWKYLKTEFYDVEQYMISVFGRYPNSWDCMLWIRCATGRLCVDLTRPEFHVLSLYKWGSNLPPAIVSSTSEPPEDSQIIESTPLEVYHEICCAYLGHSRWLPISPDASVQLGAIISCAVGTGIEDSTVIAGISEDAFDDYGWSGTFEEPLIMEDGWTRISSSELESGHSLVLEIFGDFSSRKSWLAQANYIFNRLGITSNYDDYVFVDIIHHQLTLSDTSSIPPGYLFPCPLRDLQSGVPSHFRLPECPAYWSLDPSGAERLSTEEADELGFPRLECKMNVWVCSWDESVYNGLRKFHEGKGYDPYSQDVARDRGYSLYEVASELELFEETESCSGDESSDGLPSNEVGGESGEHFWFLEGTCCRLRDAELLEPSRTWKIVMAVQFLLILASTLRFCSIKLTHPCFVRTPPHRSIPGLPPFLLMFGGNDALGLALTEAHFINVHDININEGYTTCAALAFGAETGARTARRGTPSSSRSLAAPAPIPQQRLAHAFEANLDFNAEFHSESSLDDGGSRNNQYTSAFFPKAHHLVVAGVKFKSITNITQASPTVPSDFRMIPMRDLDLREEIRPGRRSAVAKMTVAVYQGETANEEWQEDISRYSWLL